MSESVPPPPRRVVVGAGAHAELSRRIGAARPALELRGAAHTDVTAADLAWADAYLGFRRPPTPTMGSVRWVHCTGAGVDAWLYPEPLPGDVLLTRTSEPFGPAIAEWAVARALAFTQGLRALDGAQRARRWAPRDPRRLAGTRAVVVGTGEIGSSVARALGALGVHVRGVSRSGRGDPALFGSMHAVDALPALAAEADWLVVTLPLTSETRGLIGRAVLGACRGAVLLNAGRGAVVDEALLPEALDAGWLAGAALDVFETEPLPADSPLWDDPRVMVSPHISGPTTIDGAVDGFLDALSALERGELPERVVDRRRQY